LGAESLTPGNGGICRVARLIGKVLAEEAAAGWLDASAVVYRDSLPSPDLGLPTTTARQSRAGYAIRVWKASLRASHFIYDFVGTARAHWRLPPLRRPFLVFTHGIEVWEDTRPDRLAWARRADLLLCNSAYTRARADRIHGGFSRAQVCWLATERDDLPSVAHQAEGPPRVLIVGRIDPEPWKGHHALIDAWPEVVAAVPGARLVVVGDGPGMAATRARAAASSTAGTIEFEGFVPEDQMDRVWSAASVFAMPGVMEGFGLVYIEAMRYGIPVVASVHDAAPEVNLEGVTGYNVNLRKKGELAERLIHLLRNPDLIARLGDNGRQRWLEHFRFARFRDRFSKYLHSWIA
jgi:phosphatidylinositol alpha-1,6-mannosyltransferase